MLLRFRICFVIVLLYAFSLLMLFLLFHDLFFKIVLLVKRVNHFDRKKIAAVIHMLGCPFCKKTSIILQEDYEKKKGLASLLTVKCTAFDFCNYFYTSRSYDSTFDINTKAAYSMRAIGQLYSGLQTFTSLMNLPKPVTADNYYKIINRLVKTTKAVAVIKMQDAREELRADSSSNAIKDVEVSSDGTWQRRGIFLIKWGSYCNFQKKWKKFRY